MKDQPKFRPPAWPLREAVKYVQSIARGVPRPPAAKDPVLVAAIVQLSTEIATLRAELRAVKGLVVLERPKQRDEKGGAR